MTLGYIVTATDSTVKNNECVLWFTGGETDNVGVSEENGEDDNLKAAVEHPAQSCCSR